MQLLVTDDVCTFILMVMCLDRKFWTETCLSTVDLTATRPKSRQRGPAGDLIVKPWPLAVCNTSSQLCTYVPISQISGLIHSMT